MGHLSFPQAGLNERFPDFFPVLDLQVRHPLPAVGDKLQRLFDLARHAQAGASD